MSLDALIRRDGAAVLAGADLGESVRYRFGETGAVKTIRVGVNRSPLTEQGEAGGRLAAYPINVFVSATDVPAGARVRADKDTIELAPQPGMAVKWFVVSAVLGSDASGLLLGVG